jgi:hypothetical protein
MSNVYVRVIDIHHPDGYVYKDIRDLVKKIDKPLKVKEKKDE